MKFGLFFMVYNRVPYLQAALHSWEHVEGLKDWHLHFSLEPGGFHQQMYEELTEFQLRTGHPNVSFSTNDRVLGAQEHPYQGFKKLFDANFDFAVIVEDDLEVSRDALTFFEAAATVFKQSKQVLAVCAASRADGEPDKMLLSTEFSPHLWGTWSTRWRQTLDPTWDHNYDTYNGRPMNEAGWDWNINTRIMPKQNFQVVTPARSRVQDIGLWGVHTTPQTHETFPSFDIDSNEPEFFW